MGGQREEMAGVLQAVFLFVCDRCFAVAWPGGLALNRGR